MSGVDVRLTSLVYGGDAFGRLTDGRAVFVPFALPGEKVRVQLIEEKRGHARATLVEVLEPADERITPRCPHFIVCGGCQYQHIQYEQQLKVKQAILCEQLERIGGLRDIPCAHTVASPLPWNYRNHIQFHQSLDGSLGYQEARSNSVVPITECHLPESTLNTIWPQLEIGRIPGLERVSLRLGMGEEIMLIFESSDPEPFDFSVEDISISAVHLGPGGALVLAGSAFLTVQVLERQFQVSPASFFQVNTLQAEAMVQYLIEHLKLEKNTTLLDVYCGVGLFSAFLAPRVGKLVGIELSPSACEDFAVNLDEFNHVDLYEASAEVVLNNQEFHPEIILVDPPRTGLSQHTMDGLLAQAASQIAYVSCDPSTLARDAKRLMAGEYHLQQITPFDMFPQTYHIESISFWEK